MTNMTTEDDIIKKRLLIEGDSGNEDRLINKLIKNFVKWSNSLAVESNAVAATNGDAGAPGGNADEENDEYLYEQMMASLSHAEFGLSRNHFIMEMNKAEQENYETLYQKINNEIEKAKKKIVESKIDLQEARKIRKNRQEYDVIAKQIQNYPDRIEMQNTIKTLEEKVEHIKRVDAEYNKKIDLRRKQFSVVLQSLSSLKTLIETDSKLDGFEDRHHHEDGVNDDAVAPESTTGNGNHHDNAYAKLVPSREAVDDMEDDASSQSGHLGKREKHYSTSVAEVEMEEAI